MTRVQIPLIIAIRPLAGVFVHRTPKASIVINACPIHTIGSIGAVVSCVTVIISAQLAKHVIFIPDNVCVVKDSQAVDVIDVLAVILIFHVVNDAIVIEPDHWQRMVAKQLVVMMMDNVCAKHWSQD